MRYRVYSVVVVVILCVSGASAAGDAPKREAKRLFRQGATLYGKGELSAALAKFEQARALYPSYKIDLNIATVLVDLKRPAAAAEAYERCLGQSKTPRRVARRVRRKLAALSAKLSRVRVECPVTAATLKVDGEAAGHAPRQRWLYLEPGDHVIEACKPGHQCATERVTLAAGERRVVTLAPTVEVKPPIPPPVPKVVAPPTPAPAPMPRDEPRAAGWKATAGWVSVGVGTASLITGVVFGAMVRASSDEHAEAVDADKTYGELTDIADKGRTYEKVQVVTLVVGGVGLAAGAGLLLWHYLGKTRSAATKAAFVAPVVTASGCFVGGGVRF